jgi:hypothetical protein
MPDVQELFRAATDGVGAEPGFVDRQRHRQGLHERWRRAATIVVVVAGVSALVALGLASVDRRSAPATPAPTSTARPPSPMSTESSFVDVGSGRTTPLPEAIAAAGYYFDASPDRTMLTYGPCCAVRPTTVSVASIDGTVIRQLTPDRMSAFGPRWSPDGTSIVYQGRGPIATGANRFGNLFIVDPRTGETVRITHLDQSKSWGWWFLSPSFAPDGEKVIFQMPRHTGSGTRWDLWSVPITGGERTLLLRNAGFGSYAPDGHTLAYLSPAASFSGGSLWIADDRGSVPRKLVQGPRIKLPRWSPDGTRIAYAKGGNVYVVDAASGRSARVSKGGVAEWFDDDTLVVGAGGCPGC